MSSQGTTALVSLQAPRDAQTDTHRVVEPGYYVIVGRGVAALYNHLTLIDRAKKWGAPAAPPSPETDWGTQRLSAAKSDGPARLNVMHIGYREPWARRGRERMGQWPRMLDFFKGMGNGYLGLEAASGYSGSNEFQHDWLPAAVFADSLRNVEQYLDSQYRHGHANYFDRTFGVERGAAPIKAGIVFEPGFVSLIEVWDNLLIRAGTFGEDDGTPDWWERRLWDKVAKYWIGDRRWADGKPSTEFQREWKNEACEYRLSVYHKPEGERGYWFRYVYAYKIDICTGPGQPRLFPRGVFGGEDLYQEHLPERGVTPRGRGSFRPGDKPRIIDGNEFIGSTNDPGRTIIVFKGNPVGAQCVQSALDMPEMTRTMKRVWFVGNKDLRKDEANVPGDRNLLEVIGRSELPDGRPQFNEHLRIISNHRDGREWATEEYRRGRFAQRLLRLCGHEVKKISADDHSIVCEWGQPGIGGLRGAAVASQIMTRVMQELDQMVGTEAELIASFAKDGSIVKQIKSDFLVYALGQDRELNMEGSVKYVTRRLTGLHVVADPRTGFPMLVTDSVPDAEVIDFQGPATGRLRILGAAIMNSASAWDDRVTAAHFDGNDFPTPDHSTGDPVAPRNAAPRSQAGTIPREGPAGGGGLNLNIPNLLRANRHFGIGLVSLNTASFPELNDAGLTDHVARWIVAQRSATDRGFLIEEYIANIKDLVRELRTKSQKQLSQLGVSQSDIDSLHSGIPSLENNRARFKF